MIGTLSFAVAVAMLTSAASARPTRALPSPVWLRATPVTTTTTFCDTGAPRTEGLGADTPCPCRNQGAPGFGCDNPQGTGGVRLQVIAQHVEPVNRATFRSVGYPAMRAPGVVLIRSNVIEFSSVPFGDGLRCVSTLGLLRLGASVATDGSAVHTIGHGSRASGTYFYQAWYRSTPASFCDPAAAFNLSSGNSLVW